MEDAHEASPTRPRAARERGLAGGRASGREGARVRLRLVGPRAGRRRRSPEVVALTAAVDQSAAELDAELAEIGLSPKASWYTSAALYGGGGLLVTVTDAIQPRLFPSGLLYLSSVAVVMGAMCLLTARRHERWARAERWTTHARLLVGLAIWVAGTILLGDRAIVFALIPLFSLLTPCYLYPVRYALGYSLGATAVVILMVLSGSEPDRPAHALVTGVVFMGLAGALIITRSRTRALARRHRRLAYTDPLTGIGNTRALRERIAGSTVAAAGARGLFALFVMDLDNFKQVNDRFDHTRGDRVLRAVALAIAAELEPGDLAIRRGGDEFAVLAACSGKRDLAALGARLREAIVRARVETCPEVTPSGGVAWVRTRAGEELARTMERADDALHRVKAAARAQRIAGEHGAVRARPARSRPGLSRESELGQGVGDGPARAPVDGRARAPVGGRAGALAARLVSVLGNADADWGFTALALAPAAAAIALVSLAGMAAPLRPQTGAAVAGAMAALCALAFIAGRHRVRRRWLHVAWLALLALLLVAIARAGAAGTVLLDLLPGFAIFGVLIVRARVVPVYLVGALVPYGVFAITAGYPYGAARTVATAAVTAIVAGVVARLRTVTVRFARRNRELSEVDALTGVANLRALHDRVVDVVERAPAKRLRPLVVAIDLDEFKQVNDNHSHSVGDRVLVAVARAVSQCVRVDELVARRGGDEFAVVLADAPDGETEAILKRIAAAIERARLRVCPDTLATASVAAVAWEPGEAPGHLLGRADAALHEAKCRAHARAAAVAAGPLARAPLPSGRLAAAG